MIHLSDHSECSGCTACYAVCSHHAITMQTDALGFAYPVIDYNVCVECGLCEKACNFTKNYPAETELQPQEYVVIRHKQDEEIAKSRSGAVFAEMARYILAKQGVVYGAKQDESLKVVHAKVTKLEDLDAIRGSKYSQSDVLNIFADVKEELASGRPVLFSGTPCQISGLKGYLRNKEYDNLLAIDVVCHGVIGPTILQDYIKYIENSTGLQVSGMNFRNKQKFGWRLHKATFEGKERNNPQKIVELDEPFPLYDKLFYRPSCFACPYTSFDRVGDVTLADYWGIEKTNHPFNDNRGVNLIMLNSIKGKRLFQAISDRMDFFSVTHDQAVQPSLCNPVRMPANYHDFVQAYERYGFDKTMRKFNRLGWRRIIARLQRRIQKNHV